MLTVDEFLNKYDFNEIEKKYIKDDFGRVIKSRR